MQRNSPSRPKQMFSFHAPTATSVQLVGDFTHWQKHPVHLHRQSSGLWQASVELEPGAHRYRFLVDGQWQDDPECATFVPNPFGGRDAVRQVVRAQSEAILQESRL